MELIACACGCGELKPRYDKKKRERLYIRGHQNRRRTPAQREAWARNMALRPLDPWNKGKTYTHASKQVYANKGSWNKAMRRLFPDVCMRCGWGEASCDTHHIVLKSEGGQYTVENGIILCPNCHRLVHDGFLAVGELMEIRRGAIAIGDAV